MITLAQIDMAYQFLYVISFQLSVVAQYEPTAVI